MLASGRPVRPNDRMNAPTQVVARPGQAVARTSAELSARAAQRRAWFWLLASFTAFCCLSVAGASTVVNYRRSATDSPPSALRIDRGIVLYQDGPEGAQ